jgi:hypothetical protein
MQALVSRQLRVHNSCIAHTYNPSYTRLPATARRGADRRAVLRVVDLQCQPGRRGVFEICLVQRPRLGDRPWWGDRQDPTGGLDVRSRLMTDSEDRQHWLRKGIVAFGLCEDALGIKG